MACLIRYCSFVNIPCILFDRRMARSRLRTIHLVKQTYHSRTTFRCACYFQPPNTTLCLTWYHSIVILLVGIIEISVYSMVFFRLKQVSGTNSYRISYKIMWFLSTFLDGTSRHTSVCCPELTDLEWPNQSHLPLPCWLLKLIWL